MVPLLDRVLLHVGEGHRIVVDPGQVMVLEAVGDETHLHCEGRDPLVDVRPLGRIMPIFEEHGFLRIHRGYAVNLRRIKEVRRRRVGRDWEVWLTGPGERVFPVSRRQVSSLWVALGERRER